MVPRTIYGNGICAFFHRVHTWKVPNFVTISPTSRLFVRHVVRCPVANLVVNVPSQLHTPRPSASVLLPTPTHTTFIATGTREQSSSSIRCAADWRGLQQRGQASQRLGPSGHRRCKTRRCAGPRKCYIPGADLGRRCSS